MNGIPEKQMSEFAPDVIALIGTGSVKAIPLTQGKVAVVDGIDYGWLSQWKWHTYRDGNTYYAVRHSWQHKKDMSYSMHRDILGLARNDGLITDHINRNGLDNRKSNLRIVNQALNCLNGNLQKNNTSGYRGVSWLKRRSRWIVRINIDGILKYVGYFHNLTDAAIAYDKAAILHYGKNAVLNFPMEKI